MNEESFPVEAVSSFQPYKDEHISDEEIITYYSAGENEPDTWYPSESDFENWKQSRDKKNEIKEEFEQGLHEGQLLLLHLVEQEPVSDENLEGSSFIEENRAESWYPSESEVRYWKQQEEKTCIDKEEVKQVPEKNKKKNVKLLIPSARTYAGYRDLNMPTAGSIASVQSPIVVDNTSTNWMLWSMRKRKQRYSLNHEVKQPKTKKQADSRSQCPERQERNDHAEPRNAAGNAVKCRYCGICISNDYVLKHQKNCMANIAWERYPQEENLSREELVHAGRKRYSCEICGRRFTRSHDVTRHKRSHTGEKPYSCDVCGKAFSRAGILTSHKRLHSGERPYDFNVPAASSMATVQSPIVVDNTSTNWMLWSMRKERNSLSLDVKQPKKKNQAQSRSRCPQRQERNDHGEPQNAAGNAVKCRYCGICVSNDYILKHQKNCIAKSTWKRYPQEENLSREELVHAGGKRYSCEICGRRFTRSHDVTRHKRSHTGEKPYSCDVCGKAFSRAGILTSHKRLHTGERPYLCNICGKRYMHSGAFNYHKLTHKEGEQFLCEICGERFIGMEILLLHKLIHTVEQPYIFM